MGHITLSEEEHGIIWRLLNTYDTELLCAKVSVGRKSIEELKARLRPIKEDQRVSSVIPSSPRGWWITHDDKNWMGPFDTPEQAQEMGEALTPILKKRFTMVNLQLWETRMIELVKYKDCPHCDKGFTRGWSGDYPQGSVCYKCDGTGRVVDE